MIADDGSWGTCGIRLFGSGESAEECFAAAALQEAVKGGPGTEGLKAGVAGIFAEQNGPSGVSYSECWA